VSEAEVQLVLFDLDGTLVETAPEIRDALADTLHALGLAPAPLEQVETWIGQGTGTLLLRALGQRGVRRVLITNKEQRFTANVLRRHGLRPLLDRVVCGDTLPRRKPDPAGVLDCLRAFDVPARRAVLVGDSATDIATARDAGIPVWALAHGYNRGEPIAAAAPDRVLDSLRAVLQ